MISSILAFLFVFTLVVLVHESGHFMAARKTGVKVYEFSIGFPFSPRIFNLPPLPALDGGHILIILIESIKRRSFSTG
ncbi:MAG: site-2 protease family protein, partial [Deltaproteobacteria bacterium]